jgi:TolA-binding protein
MTSRTITRRSPGAGGWVAAVLLVAAAGTPGCYTAQMTQLTGGLDSLRMQVAELNARDSVSAVTLEATRRELAEQRDMLASTRATASSTARQTDETLGRLEGKLDDIMSRFRIATERQPAKSPAEPPPDKTPSGGTMPPSTGSTGGPGPTQAYDQATTDLTQGRYAMALTGYRAFLKRFPEHDLAHNALYGAGACFFAPQSTARSSSTPASVRHGAGGTVHRHRSTSSACARSGSDGMRTRAARSRTWWRASRRAVRPNWRVTGSASAEASRGAALRLSARVWLPTLALIAYSSGGVLPAWAQEASSSLPDSAMHEVSARGPGRYGPVTDSVQRSL